MRKPSKMRAAAPKNRDFQNILRAMKGLRAVVAGDVMLDRFIYGGVERISPESPVPILNIEREERMLGGAGNALANLAGLGLGGDVFSIVGDDADGKFIRQKIKSLGFEISGLLTDPTRPTIVKTRYLAGHQQLLRADFESRKPLPPKISAQLREKAKTVLKNAHVLILSDYGKGALSREIAAALISAARARKIPVVADPKGRDFSIYSGADAITPNRKELTEASGLPVDTDEQVNQAAKKIIRECGVRAVAATRSKDGISVISQTAKPVHIRGRDIEVFDVSGAGDAVVAVIGAALATGASLEDAACLANIAGGLVVAKVGTAPVRAEEIRECLDDGGEFFAYADKKAPVATWNAAAEQVRRWRSKGRKIGFTNGCFDILHAGHVSYLNAARGQCDRLIVGLNRDSSVRILKGARRPVHDENSRAAVLAALASVDMVVLFGAGEAGEDNTASELIRTLRPDIYFKGGDYKESDIPEAKAARACGCEIRLMPNFEGHSTTRSIKKIRAAS